MEMLTVAAARAAPAPAVPEGLSCNLNGRDTEEVSVSQQQQQQQQPLRLSRPLVPHGTNVCRICHTNNGAKEALISPCRCKGTLAHVHLSCLERWLNQSCRTYCELCLYHFNAVETLRYRWRESLRIWISHPQNRRNIQSDFLIFTLLTIVTIGLIAVCLLGMRYFVIEGRKIGITRTWTKGVVIFFLAVVVLGYLTTVYLLAKDQLSPWYRWWKSMVNVRLVMETSKAQGETFQEHECQTAKTYESDAKVTEAAQSKLHVLNNNS